MNPEPANFSECAVCHYEKTFFVMSIKDHSVSKENFNVNECPRCGLRFTTQAPGVDKIGPYYQSENYISHSNTRKGIVNTAYHLVRNHTLSVKFHLLEKTTGLLKGDHLDIGAGTGAFVQYMNGRGWKSTGIEPDDNARERAKEHHQTILLPAENLELFVPESFDTITMWHVLEHVHDLYPYMETIKKIVKPSGFVFIAVPNYMSYDAGKYGVNWAAYDVPRHLYHFSPSSMKWLLDAAGFKLVKEIPLWWDSYYISLLSEKYTGNKAAMIRGFLNGALSNIRAIADKEKCSSLIYVARKKDSIF